LGAAGTNAAAVGYDKLADNGVIYRGMELFGGGATLAGLILGAIAVFIIDREFEKAAIYSGIGAVLAFFGFINGTQLAIGNSAPVALGYAVLGVTCLAFTWGRLKQAAAQRPDPLEMVTSEGFTE
jgi:AGZA family xanthine/uracil permease-like MFS transporter